jgi:ABC-type Co2+ transport system, permease component
MHIPDAFYSFPQAAVYWIIALVFLALAIKWARSELNEVKSH